MNAHWNSHRVVAAIALVIGALGTAACTSWRVQGLSPAMVILQDQPRVIRITRIDSSQVVVDGPRLIGDSLMGWTGENRFSAPLSDVVSASLRRGDGAKTAGLVLLATIGAMVGLIALFPTW